MTIRNLELTLLSFPIEFVVNNYTKFYLFNLFNFQSSCYELITSIHVNNTIMLINFNPTVTL